jgi:phytoene/squalene synthetase
MLERWLSDPPMQHPIMRALSRTIVRNQLPREVFRRLLDAFRFDAALEPFPTEEALLAYCSNSAAPIGELLLRLETEWNERTAPHSDAFCAGLQVLNFWQDIGCDLQRGRSTIPHEWIGGQPLTWGELSGSADLRKMIAGHFDRMVGRLLPAGIALSQAVRSKRLRLQVRATFAAASVVWRACQRRGEHFIRRPRLRWWHVPAILGATLIAPRTS